MYHTNLNNDKRNQLKAMMDDFTTFNWGEVIAGQTAFDKFGAFIVGGKDALKFYNGPGFSNKYITTQFQSQNSTLQGVEFKTMTISFTMGVYWFTIEEYRELLLWLHPYEVSQLSFSFAPKWYYLAKLANISDSNRHILGKDSDGNYRYYTEIKLTFDVQGEPCLHYFDNYEIEHNNSDPTNVFSFRNVSPTDLDTPFDLEFSLEKTGSSSTDSISLTIEIPNGSSTTSHQVFNLLLKNLDNGKYNFSYDSAQGILFLGDKTKLLSAQTTARSGKRILDSLMINTFKLPGVLESGLSYNNFKEIKFNFTVSSGWSLENANLLAHARTNVI